MLAFLLLYFIGKQFYNLAESFQKNGWGYAIAGIAAYYGGTFIGGFIIAIAYLTLSTTPYEEANEYGLTLLALPFGLLGCWVLYRILKNNWEKKPASAGMDILDEDILH